jgi:superfamily I DNA/RNA helicase
MIFKFTVEQENVIEKVKKGGHVYISAVAGASKTTMAKHYSQFMKNACYTTFNTHNIEHAKSVKVDADCRSLHSIGSRGLTRFKAYSLLPDKAARIYKNLQLKGGSANFQRAWNMFRSLNLADHTQWDLVENRGLELNDSWLSETITNEIIYMNEDLYTKYNYIDFIDMLYLPPRILNRGWIKYGSMIVDECYDLSPAALNLLRHGQQKGTQNVFCGDIDQSIYDCFGSSGANLKQSLKNWDTVSLNTSFRCRSVITEIAQSYTPRIRSFFEGGTYTELDYFDVENLRKGDLIIASTYADLMPAYLSALSNKYSCYLRGVDIIISVITEIRKRINRSGVDFHNAVTRFIIDVDDQIDSLMFTLSNEERRKTLNIKKQILSMFLDSFNNIEECGILVGREEGEANFIFSSIHRSKGLEGERVHILGYLNNLDTEGLRDEEIRKLAYVGVTRAKHDLFVYP